MSENSQDQDENLIDFILGRCDADAAGRIKQRLARDASLSKQHQDLTNTFAALSSMGEVEPPADLVDKTLSRIARERQRQSATARADLGRRVGPSVFSLRELAAMAAIFILLASVFIPSIQRARQQNRIAQCGNQAGQIGTALLTYANSNGDFLPGAGSGQKRWMAGNDQPAVSNSAALYKLVRFNYAPSPVLFQCPAVGGESFVVKPGAADFPAAKYIHYSYQHTVQRDGLPLNDKAFTGPSSDMAILADSSPVFPEGQFQRDRVNSLASDNHGRKGQNVLYLDMHVGWREKPNVGVAGNNIFLADDKARTIVDYQGEETPVSAADSFLLPAFSGGGK